MMLIQNTVWVPNGLLNEKSSQLFSKIWAVSQQRHEIQIQLLIGSGIARQSHTQYEHWARS